MFSSLELTAVILAFLAVVLQWREHSAAWWLILLSSVAYIKLFWDAGLLMDSALQIFFIVLAVKGIFSWGRANTGVRLNQQTRLFHARVLLLGFIVTGLLALFSHSVRHVAMLIALTDAGIFVFSLVTVWMTERKIIESWLYWIVIDIVAAMLYLSRDLTLTAALYLAYVPLAAAGYREWQHRYRRNVMCY